MYKNLKQKISVYIRKQEKKKKKIKSDFFKIFEQK